MSVAGVNDIGRTCVSALMFTPRQAKEGAHAGAPLPGSANGSIMPNHFHGIVMVGADLCVRPDVHVRQSKAGVPLSKIDKCFPFA
jgi:hypothetical protein